MSWLASVVSLLAVLFIAAPTVQAAQVGGKDSFNLPRTSPKTASAGTGSSGGGSDFGTLLSKPSTLSTGGMDFQDMLKMPFMPPDMATVRALVTPKNIAKGLLGGVAAYTAGEALENLIKEACVRGMGGSLVMNPDSPIQECVPVPQSDGYEYEVDYDGLNGWRWTPDFFKSLDLTVINFNASNAPADQAIRSTCTRTSTTVAKCKNSAGVENFTFTLDRRVASSCPAGWYVTPSGCSQTKPEQTYQPVSREAAESKLESVVKDMSKAPKTLEAVKDMFARGGKLELEAPTITGPASGQPSTSTSSQTSGSETLTKTTTVVNNYTYTNNTVTVNQTTTTTTRDAAGNVVSTTTEEAPPEEAPTDTGLPPVPNLYERKYPDGMEGIWNDHKDQLKNTELVQLAKDLMPTVGSSGTCPSWPLNLDFAEWAAYGSHDVAPPCWIWDVARAILILSALLLARALIFGG
jgi:hypothetical protein